MECVRDLLLERADHFINRASRHQKKSLLYV